MNATAEAALFSWAFQPLPAFGILLSVWLYVRGWRKLRQMVPHRYPVWKLASFLSGMALVYFALASPLDAFGFLLLSVHMTQHLLLTMVAPPLILFGAPQLPMLCGLPRVVAREAVGPFLTWSVLRRVEKVITHPIFCLAAFMLSNVLWHTTGAYEQALHAPNWHVAEHVCFIVTSLLFWWHVIEPWPCHPVWPRWAMVFYVLAADIQNTALGGFLTMCEEPLYPTYSAAPRVAGISVMDDQTFAGVLMWGFGQVFFLLPVAFIMINFLSRKREMPSPPPQVRPAPVKARERFDLLKAPVIGAVMRWPHFRRVAQGTLFLLALAIVTDGLFGPRIAPMNLAGTLPWTHWRACTVVALLVAGNLFCMACPFTFFRDLGRKIFPARWRWPKALRSKWLAVALLAGFFWAYEVFSLWNSPWWTAWIIIGYFVTSLLVDGFFKGASFCKYVCPIGQFHFLSSLASPLEVAVRQPDVCTSCKTHDCIRGNEEQRGCELMLFQPRKAGNMDCTFCLDCVKACPHDNVGIMSARPGLDLIADRPRSSVGRYARRPDLAMLAVVFVFGSFANAAGMVVPVLQWEDGLRTAFGAATASCVISGALLAALLVVPAACALVCGWLGRKFGGVASTAREVACQFAIALAPLGFSMWAAHFLFHFFTGATTPIPVAQRIAHDFGLWSGQPFWAIPSLAFDDLPGFELLILDCGLLFTLYILWKKSRLLAQARAWGAFLPWAVLAVLLYAAGVWIIFQPMQMRGTMMN